MTTAARLDLRLNSSDKTSIRRATELRGVPLAAFVREAALRESERVMASEHTFVSSVSESRYQRDGISTTHVLVERVGESYLLGYYSLVVAQMLLAKPQEADRRRLPRYPVPAIRMARLAVATGAQGKGHGDFLLAHAVVRCLDLREQLGLWVILVDALHAKAARFYRAYGFRDVSGEGGTLYLPLGTP